MLTVARRLIPRTQTVAEDSIEYEYRDAEYEWAGALLPQAAACSRQEIKCDYGPHRAPVPCRRCAAVVQDLFLGFRGLTPTARGIPPLRGFTRSSHCAASPDRRVGRT